MKYNKNYEKLHTWKLDYYYIAFSEKYCCALHYAYAAKESHNRDLTQRLPATHLSYVVLLKLEYGHSNALQNNLTITLMQNQIKQ